MPPLHLYNHDNIIDEEAAIHYQCWIEEELDEDINSNQDGTTVCCDSMIHAIGTFDTSPPHPPPDVDAEDDIDFGFAVMGPPPSALYKQTSSPPGQQRRLLPPKRSVHFSDVTHNQVWLIPHWKDYTDSEVQERWNSGVEYQRFRLDVSDTLYLLASAPHMVDGGEYTARGVEGRAPDVILHRHRVKNEARSAVLEEQSYQQAMGEEPNEALIAAVYSQASKEAEQDALDVAQLDAVDALRFQKEGNEEREQHLRQLVQEQQCQDWLLSDSFDDSWISSVASVCEYSSHPQQSFESSTLDVCDSVAVIFDKSWLTEGTPCTTALVA
jgi:hypothetical protein